MKPLLPVYSIGQFINQPSNTTEFEITRFETMEEPDVDNIHKHTFYEILWTEKGASRQTIDYKEYDVTPNTLFFISPNQVHQFEQWKPLQGGTILFTEDFFLLGHNDKDQLFELSFLDNFYSNPCIRFDKKDFAEIKQLIDMLCREHLRKDTDPMIKRALLHILLSQVQRYIGHKKEELSSKKNLVLFKKFKLLLDIHFAENKLPAFYASQLHVTSHHLNRVIKNVTGKTAGEVIRARSILEAKRLLTFTDLTVSEIAGQLNYFDSSYFAKLFKKETNSTPAAFKTDMSKKYLTK